MPRPMSYLRAFGERARWEVQLTWGVLIISIAVVLIVTVLVVVGVGKRRITFPLGIDGHTLIARTGNGLRWIYVGLGISTLVLIGSLVWTMLTLAAINRPREVPTVNLHITAQQWWWKVQYLSDYPSRTVYTANEIHIPVGRAVRVKLNSVDVIHSFWIPTLGGKTDVIPGQTNITWLEADRPGKYRGQCTEYCGAQHAHMALFVIAESPASFRSWLNHQLQDAPAPTSARIAEGERLAVYHCGTCHTIRGTDAGGVVAPDLTHLMSRQTIAAGTLPNNIGYLSGWIADPQSSKPGNHMPVLYLSGPDLNDIRSFLVTLK